MLRLAVFCALSATCALGMILCPKDYCTTVQCSAELTVESCAANGGRFAEKGGFCGCCPSCIAQIGKVASSTRSAAAWFARENVVLLPLRDVTV